MNHTLFPILLGGLLCAAAIFAGNAAAQAPESVRPNVIFLFTDDQRADTIGALGNEHIKTPRLDALARRGFVFNSAYCLGGNSPAVCSPSRNMLLSGRTYFRWEGRLAPATDATFPAVMKAAGYETYHHGKRGNSATEIHKQFDTSKYVQDEQDRTSGEPCRTIVSEAIDFLGERKRGDKPVFMYLAFSNPHDPRVAAQKYLDLYKREKLPLPKNFKTLHPFNNGEQLVRDEKLAGFPRTEEEVRRHLHDYYAVISAMDHHIGRLLDAVKELGMEQNTIFVFSSDHGLAIGSHGLMGKQNLYEDGMRVPLFFAGPGIPQGETSALCYLHDIFPTICDLVGTKTPAGLDGRSQREVIDGKSKGVRDTLFLAYRDVQRAVRDDRYKLIRYPQVNVTQLFDLQADPHEVTNLALDPQHARRIETLTAEMQRWQKELGDRTPLVVDKPQDPAFAPPKPPADERNSLRLRTWRRRTDRRHDAVFHLQPDVRIDQRVQPILRPVGNSANGHYLAACDPREISPGSAGKLAVDLDSPRERRLKKDGIEADDVAAAAVAEDHRWHPRQVYHAVEERLVGLGGIEMKGLECLDRRGGRHWLSGKKCCDPKRCEHGENSTDGLTCQVPALSEGLTGDVNRRGRIPRIYFT